MEKKFCFSFVFFFVSFFISTLIQPVTKNVCFNENDKCKVIQFVCSAVDQCEKKTWFEMDKSCYEIMGKLKEIGSESLRRSTGIMKRAVGYLAGLISSTAPYMYAKKFFESGACDYIEAESYKDKITAVPDHSYSEGTCLQEYPGCTVYNDYFDDANICIWRRFVGFFSHRSESGKMWDCYDYKDKKNWKLLDSFERDLLEQSGVECKHIVKKLPICNGVEKKYDLEMEIDKYFIPRGNNNENAPVPLIYSVVSKISNKFSNVLDKIKIKEFLAALGFWGVLGVAAGAVICVGGGVYLVYRYKNAKNEKGVRVACISESDSEDDDDDDDDTF